MTTKELRLNLKIFEDEADEERLDKLTTSLLRDFRDFDLESIGRPKVASAPEGTRGDPVTFGAIALAVLPSALPALIVYLQNWLGNNRKVTMEAPNGAKLEFTAKKKLSEEEILAMIEKLSKVTASKTDNPNK